MKYRKELTVGLTIILAVVVFVLGLRFFQDLPLFRGTYTLYTTFENAQGLVQGNAVRVNGIAVGGIDEVRLAPEQDAALVRFHVDEGIRVPEGSFTEIGGVAALANVNLDLNLGPIDNPPIPEGGFVPSRTGGTLSAITENLPGIASRLDSVLASANVTLEGAAGLFTDPNQELRQTLASIRTTAVTLDRLLRAEQARLDAVLTNLGGLTADLRGFSETGADTLRVAVERLNRTLAQLDRNLVAIETTTTRLDSVFAKIDRGEGTLGLLVNDPGLYRNLDSAALNLNQLLNDFQQNPGRYLRELELVDIF